MQTIVPVEVIERKILLIRGLANLFADVVGSGEWGVTKKHV
jgi:hypothetical protein